MRLEKLIAVARGEEPADLWLRNAQLVNVLSGEIHAADIAIYDGLVVGLGQYEARQVVDLEGRFVCPGLIDAHMHLESSMVQPAEFARAVLPHGTTTIVCDPHEIANVLGLDPACRRPTWNRRGRSSARPTSRRCGAMSGSSAWQR